MIRFDNGGILLQPGDELPPLPDSIDMLYGDFETTSRSKSLTSLNPWHNCWPLGFAFTWDDMRDAYYLPMLHWETRWNFAWDQAIDYIFEIFRRVKNKWVNQNVKYDYHVLHRGCGIDFNGTMRCTLTQAKLKHSDMLYSGGYGLDNLSDKWLKENIDKYGKAMEPYLNRNKDYGAVPGDIMAEYACQDVITNRRLDKFLIETMPEDTARQVHIEERFTSILARMERYGIRVDREQIQLERYKTLLEMREIEHTLHALVGRQFIPTSNDDCHDVLINQFGLPVLEYTDAGNASFDKHVLKAYSTMVGAPTDVVSAILEYRSLSTYKGLFLETYEDLMDENGILHCTVNQRVRTGRLSIGEPNFQQLDKRAKKLILPRPGNSIMSADASQIEFRIIGHYIKDEKIIESYAKDADADYHQLVADFVEISRKPAKQLNFQNAYGGGKKKCVSSLATNKEVVGALMAVIDEMVATGKLQDSQRDAAFRAYAQRKGEQVYDRYHSEFPGIKSTSRQAGQALRAKGYVMNLYGVHRQLPNEHSHKAFNSLCQSSAADMVKSQMVELYDVYQQANVGLEYLVQVHDDVTSEGPTEVFEDPRTARDIVAVLEDVKHTTVPLRVPIRFKYGISNKCWLDAATQERSVPVEDVAQAEQLSWLSR